MSRAENKATRLLQIENLLLAHPEGLTQAQIAERVHVDRSTITRYIPDFPKHIYYDEEDGRRWKVDRTADLINVCFNLHEATAVHLASRLLATRMDKQNPYAASTLRKLGIALERIAPHISNHLSQSADVMDTAAQRHDPNFLRTLEQLTLAWAEGRKVKIWHRQTCSDKAYSYIFSPYFIEPYAVGQSVHVIGFREPPKAIRTFKIERIERIEALNQCYSIPADFDPGDLLKDAWGIWYTEAEPVRVVLRFQARIAQRIRETRWHASEQIIDQPDGSILWEARIAEPKEMLPWIRGFGADVEVLEPEGMRAALAREVKIMVQIYGITEKRKNLFAHFRGKDKEHKEPQYLMEHLTTVSELAGKFADKIGLKETGEILGLLHDLGKASQEFQNYLLSGEGLKDPDADDYVNYREKKGKIDHSTAGAQLVYEALWNKGQKEKIAAQLLSLCLASHHSGLIDCLKPNGENNFQRRMEKPDTDTHKVEALSNLPEVKYKIEEFISAGGIEQIVEKLKSLQKEEYSNYTLFFSYGLLIRFLLSCLLDADRLDTADFETPDNLRIRNYGKYQSWSVLTGRLEERFAEFADQTATLPSGRANEVNQLRAQVAQACLENSEKPKGIYQLTVPTGGGKTLASLRFALHHAQTHNMDRVFYIIPYTSIIDQNAEEVRKILEDKDKNGNLLDKVVLEHHSNLTPEEETHRNHLLAENWDAPVVFTTQVQFLEALFGSGTRNARRMHQLANAVIILDEVQTIPINTLHMFNEALRFLSEGCGASIVLCTATQPPLDSLDNPYRQLTILPEQRIIQNEKELFEKLKRVEVFDERKPDGWDDNEVADLVEQQLEEKGSVLIVVNTKKSARNLYLQIKSRNIPNIFHLSTSMCPAHRLDALDEVKELLKHNKPVICVSTQLIEAGVDIDFGSVIRYLAGLDSIAQSAGRCNRHGIRSGFGHVWIVNPDNENIDRLKEITIGSDKAQTFLDNFKENPKAFDGDRIGLEAMAAYYRSYYHQRKEDMDYKVGPQSMAGRNDDLFNLLSMNQLSVDEFSRMNGNIPSLAFRQSFQTAAREFRVIDSPTQGIVVPYKNGGEIILDLCGTLEIDKLYPLMKRAQRYSVNLFTHDFNRLFKAGIIREVQEGAGIFYLDDQYYSNEFGWSGESVNEMKIPIV
jgi:CRISPR-associated endonuclease/helicase Cas3